MRSISYVLIFFLLSVSSAFAAVQVVTEEKTYDFGQVVEGEKVQFTFRFRNVGDEVLVLSNVRSSCGCTAALLSSSRIAPGDIGELQATFDSKGFRGAVNKTIFVETNAPEQPEITFGLFGMVQPVLLTKPDRVRWGKVESTEPLEAVVTIVNQSDVPVVLQDARVTSENIAVALDVKQLAPGEEAHLRVTGTFAAEKTRIGGYIIVRTDHPRVPQLRVAVSARLAK